MAAIPPSQDPNKMSSTFAGLPPDSHGPRWDALWHESFTPWDRGGPSLALHDLLIQSPDLFPGRPPQPGKKKTALVPGCGQGHDVLLLAARGYDVVGLDYSAEATRRATANQDAVRASGEKGATDEVYEVREGVERGTVTWATGDFFAYDFKAEIGVERFDLIFDYTFFCALPPSSRPKWASRMARLLAVDGGRLVCLEWPLPKAPDADGPPWGLTPDMYLAHLGHPGAEVAYRADGNVDVERLAPAAEGGLRRLARVTPARTHEQGRQEDGEVHDRVSVWCHGK